MPPQIQSQPDITPDEVHAELDAVLRSPQFQRSEKLQAFLRFICETSLQGNGAEINEYLIGSKVFRRGEHYNPSEDSIVRRHAHAMRQKLQEYYAGEGSGHAIRIEMPVGRYVPVFRRREDFVAEIAIPRESPPAHRPRTGQRRLLWIAAAIAIFALGWTGATISTRASARTATDAGEIWGPWFGSQAVICFSNPMAALLRQFPGPVTSDVTLHSMKAPPDQEGMFREKFALPAGGHLYFFPTIAQTMMGEASASIQIATLFAHTGIALRTMESRFLSWEALRRDNYVILAGDVENHWVDAILARYPLRLSVPPDGSPRSIVNTAPRAGEPSSFRVAGDNEAREEYALISMLPGVAENHQLLLICGLNSPAAPSATEFLTSEKALRELRDRLHGAAPDHSGPWHFQAVIKADVRDKVATTASIVVLRIL